jgi:hypothetical protein
LTFAARKEAQHLRLTPREPDLLMQAKAFLAQRPSAFQVASPQRQECEPVEQDCNPPVVAEPAELGEARLVIASRILELAEDRVEATVGAKGTCIMRKLGAHDRTDLVKYAIRTGTITPG